MPEKTIFLSNIHLVVAFIFEIVYFFEDGDWNCVANTRLRMRSIGTKKPSGASSIEVDNKVSVSIHISIGTDILYSEDITDGFEVVEESMDHGIDQITVTHLKRQYKVINDNIFMLSYR
uniref:Uncharacterized protein n=1 Tax=Cucumis melo TaxID=3656 RepID=A0A9I9E9V4_CUCME